MADYFVDESGNVTTKKKKKKKTADYRVDNSGKVTKISNDDIAPTRNTYDHLTTQEELQTEIDKLEKDTGFWDDVGTNLKAFFVGLGDEKESKKILDEHKSKEEDVSKLRQKLAERKKQDEQTQYAINKMVAENIIEPQTKNKNGFTVRTVEPKNPDEMFTPYTPDSYNDSYNGGETNSWFKAGAYDDGYQTGDFLKTVGGTVGDVLINAGAGAGSP